MKKQIAFLIIIFITTIFLSACSQDFKQEVSADGTIVMELDLDLRQDDSDANKLPKEVLDLIKNNSSTNPGLAVIDGQEICQRILLEAEKATGHIYTNCSPEVDSVKVLSVLKSEAVTDSIDGQDYYTFDLNKFISSFGDISEIDNFDNLLAIFGSKIKITMYFEADIIATDIGKANGRVLNISASDIGKIQTGKLGKIKAKRKDASGAQLEKLSETKTDSDGKAYQERTLVDLSIYNSKQIWQGSANTRQEIVCTELNGEKCFLKDMKVYSKKIVAKDSMDETNIEVIKGKMSNSLKGRILLRAEENGEAYYLNPVSDKVSYLGRPVDAFKVIKQEGIGITNDNLAKIPIALSFNRGIDSDGDGLSDDLELALGLDAHNLDSDGDGYSDKEEIINGYNPLGSGLTKHDANFTKSHLGKIFLQVEGKGEAWYLNPLDAKRYLLGKPADAFLLMKNLSLGVSNKDMYKIIRYK